ncbi:hypothetical protein PMZ80_009795 [Knufia obscura]|uniref:DJ-1/PfpI domain-containing protein n=1 Tax=Knufia obscura TaxID=1635080 RepID=A0ABR0RC53_9EURO|nr:hypothetical protein PMZ80_009795 [Knufia obscura]
MPLTNTSVPTPQNFFVVLYHGHQLLDSAGPLDILSTITKTQQGRNFTLTFLAEDLGAINLAAIPPVDADWDFEESGEMPRDDEGMVGGRGFNPTLNADVSFEDALRELRDTGKVEVNVRGRNSETGRWEVRKESRNVDVLFIPGGIGSRLYRVDNVSGERTLNVKSAIEFVRAVCLEGYVRSAVMTVCTGSDLLAHTGLLDGRRATTNAMAFEKVAKRHEGVKWLEKRRWVRSLPEEVQGKEGGFDGEIWTSAGISAGMDLMLWFVAEVWGGDFARGVGRRLEYEWRENVGEGEVDPYYE